MRETDCFIITIKGVLSFIILSLKIVLNFKAVLENRIDNKLLGIQI